MDRVLVADSIHKSYRGRKVLAGAFLVANSGEVMALIGRNGAGKSTLLRICSGEVHADAGIVEFAGIRAERPSAAALTSAGLCYLPVDRPTVPSGFSLKHFFRAIRHRYGDFDEASLVRTFGIEGHTDVPIRSLSGGERRRAYLALAWARKPRCLLLDEPFHGLGPKDAEQLQGQIRRLAAQGTAVVVTGHEVELLFPVADRIVWVENDGTRDLGSPQAGRPAGLAPGT